MATQSSMALTSQNATLPHLPELFNPDFLDVLVPVSNADTLAVTMNANDALHFPTNSFMARLRSDDRAYNKNMAMAFDSTGSATLDAFNFLNRWSYREVKEHLDKAWSEDPVVTLRLIWNIRSIHDGKSEKELFYRAYGWLYDNHPRTALSNLHMLVSPSCTTSKDKNDGRPHGYWKDLLNILALATCDELSNITKPATFLHNYPITKKTKRRWSNNKPRKTPEEIKTIQERESARAREKRKELHRQFHARLSKKLENDTKYRALYITAARMFAEQIRSDVKVMEELKTVNIKEDNQRWYALLKSFSLAGKWAPSPSGSHDRITNISTAICLLLFSPDRPPAVGPLPSAAPHPIPNNPENCIILRSFYGRWVLKPLREILRPPRRLISEQKRTKRTRTNYGRIPSVSMAKNKSRLIQRNLTSFEQYMADVDNGKKKISGATLMPHELIGEAIRLVDALGKVSESSKFPLAIEMKKRIIEQEIKVVNAQWRTLVAKMKESGSFESCIALCDVSAGMGYLSDYDPKDVSLIFPAIGLTLVLASLTKPPFNAGFIAFSSVPQFVGLENMEEKGLVSVVEELSRRGWRWPGRRFDFIGVFKKLILSIAKEHGIAKKDMIKRVFVFSEMEFDEDKEGDDSDGYDDGSDYMDEDHDDDWNGDEKGSNKLKTAHDKVEEAYRKAGYDVPEIVYWKLTGSGYWRETVHVKSDRKGAAMMSGFSPAMLKIFMTGEGAEGSLGGENGLLTPLSVMRKVLFKKSYERLVVVD